MRMNAYAALAVCALLLVGCSDNSGNVEEATASIGSAAPMVGDDESGESGHTASVGESAPPSDPAQTLDSSEPYPEIPLGGVYSYPEDGLQVSVTAIYNVDGMTAVDLTVSNPTAGELWWESGSYVNINAVDGGDHKFYDWIDLGEEVEPGAIASGESRSGTHYFEQMPTNSDGVEVPVTRNMAREGRPTFIVGKYHG